MIISDLIKQYPKLKENLTKIPSYAVKHCTIKEFKIGSAILKKGDQLEYVYILLEGIVNIYNEFETGDCFHFAETKAIDILGEIEFLAQENLIASTCSTETKCVALQIPLKILEKWVNDDSKFFHFISSSSAKKNYKASIFQGTKLIYPSIHLMKIYIVRHLKSDIGTKPYSFLEKSRQNISEELGICVRSVNRTIRKLKLEGLVSIKNGKIYITKTQYRDICYSLEQIQ